ncbi:MAG: putative DNA-binding domain-containing protein [Algicola sp.]|nr:putative DNA-binding domain-containing protein [Algicola sp.]
MSDLKTIQQDFMAFLQGKPSQMTKHIKSQQPVATSTRLGIYQNAYISRLRETIDSDHPILGSYLGDDLFDQMVPAYIEQYPSSYPSLRDFCQHIPQFLRDNAPFSEHPILAELAAFEQILINAFDAADATAVGPEKLGTIPPQSWPTMKLRFRPCVQRFGAHWNCVQSWQMLKQEKQPPPPQQLTTPTLWILWRNPERLTEFRSMEPDEAMLLDLALKGGDFADMCDALLNFHGEDEVAMRALTILQQWIELGLIGDIRF